jgi:heme A synthase
VTLYVLLVVYLGAYVRHAGLSLACADWPLCNGQVIPRMEGPTGVVFAHRLAAAGVVGFLTWLAWQARTRDVGGRAAAAALALSVLQALSGAVVVWSQLGLFSTLAHAGIMALLFACLAYLVRLALSVGERAASTLVRLPGQPAIAGPGGEPAQGKLGPARRSLARRRTESPLR